jgi:alkylation response protein AidB-like acyl-CoA dehydrogenase
MPTASSDDTDLAALRTGIRDVLEREAARERVQAFVAGGGPFNTELWASAAELGWPALPIAEAHGGLSLDFAALAVLYEELGRCVAPLPLVGSMLVAEALARGGSPGQQAEWLPRIASGEAPAALALDCARSFGGVWLTRDGDMLTLSGRAGDLIEGGAARLLLIGTAEADGTPHYVLVEPEADGVSVVVERTADQTRHLAHADFQETRLPAGRLLPGPAGSVADALLNHGALALACDAMGGAAAILDLTIDYLKIREQFGKPIGSFQALKHRCADHKVALESSGALVREAVAKQAAGSADAPLFAAMAKFQACDTYAAIATDAVQLHGGIGFTWEHPCHLYLKRAKLNQALFGTSAAYADRAAELLMAA